MESHWNFWHNELAVVAILALSPFATREWQSHILNLEHSKEQRVQLPDVEVFCIASNDTLIRVTR